MWSKMLSENVHYIALSRLKVFNLNSLRARPHYASWPWASWRGPKVTVCPEATPQVTRVTTRLTPVGVENLEE